MFSRIVSFSIACLSALLLMGCLEVNETIVIEDDLSGRIRMKVSFFTPEGQQITEEEFAIQKKRQAQRMEEEKSKLLDRLPEGVRVDEYAFVRESDHKVTILQGLSFDHIRLLTEIKAEKTEGSEEAGPDTDFLQTFHLEEKDGVWTLEHRIGEKKASGEAGAPDMDLGTQLEGRFFVLVLETGLDVIDSNSTETGPGRWTWKVPMKEIVNLEEDRWARIRFRTR